MPNVQQPEMRRSGDTRLVQDSDGPPPGSPTGSRREHRAVPPDQRSPYGSGTDQPVSSQDPPDRPVEGD